MKRQYNDNTDCDCEEFMSYGRHHNNCPYYWPECEADAIPPKQPATKASNIQDILQHLRSGGMLDPKWLTDGTMTMYERMQILKECNL